MSNLISRINTSFKESYEELVYKVSWPTRTELSNSAVVVMVASIIIALIVFAMDFCFENIMRLFYEGVM